MLSDRYFCGPLYCPPSVCDPQLQTKTICCMLLYSTLLCTKIAPVRGGHKRFILTKPGGGGGGGGHGGETE